MAISGRSGMARESADRASPAGMEGHAQAGRREGSLPRYLTFEAGEIFDLPENPAPCCSGVFGLDFLRRNVVELHPGAPMEVLLWPIDGYRPPEGFEWVELRERSGKAGLEPVCSERV